MNLWGFENFSCGVYLKLIFCQGREREDDSRPFADSHILDALRRNKSVKDRCLTTPRQYGRGLAVWIWEPD